MKENDDSEIQDRVSRLETKIELLESSNRSNHWVSVVSIIIAGIALLTQMFWLSLSNEANDTAKNGNQIAENANNTSLSGVKVAEEAKVLQEKGLRNDYAKNLQEMVEKLSTNPIYLCNSHLNTPGSKLWDDCRTDSMEPNNIHIQNGLTGLAMIGGYMKQDASKEAILSVFPKEMLESLCYSTEIKSSLGYSSEQDEAVRIACWFVSD